MEYTPGNIPDNPAQLALVLREELQRIAEVLNTVATGQVQVLYNAPEKPRTGLYFADGVHWNPGAGRGLYLYDEAGSTYTKL